MVNPGQRKFVCLSHPLARTTPRPEGLPAPALERFASLPQDPSNVFVISLCNHVGTHIDGPNHFNALQPPLVDWPIETFVFRRVNLVDIPKRDGEVVTASDVCRLRIDRNCDLLLIRTGFGAVRKTDPDRYQNESPGFSAEAASFVTEHMSSVRALGIDTLSFASPRKLEEGIRAHQILMCETSSPRFLIEDLNLPDSLTGILAVFAFPMWCEELDSAPCTVVAELRDEELA